MTADTEITVCDLPVLVRTGPVRHTVYSMYDADGRCLYVGLTESPADRLPAHRTKPWWPYVRRINFLDADPCCEGLALEAALIALERPLHNDSRGALSRVLCVYEDCTARPEVLVGINHRAWLSCLLCAAPLPEAVWWPRYRLDHKLTSWRCLPRWWIRALPKPA